MAANARNQEFEITEDCARCGTETAHDVEITITTTAREPSDTAKYAREPCRVSECRICGEETIIRMNHV